MMNNRVYYGEYSLAYWIELILTKKIVLPKYQRYFVWNEDRLETLIETLKDNRFVPPVTIGSFRNENGTINYIIDGQQRLTCILLAYLGIFPDRDKYKSHLTALADGTAHLLEDGTDPFDNVLEWNFQYLTDKGNHKDQILSKIESGNYKNKELHLDADFWKNTFLGFSYIIPNDNSTEEQQKFYTKVFKEINIQGVKLLPQESRKSLYFLKEHLEGFFEPSFASQYKVTLVGENQQMDFVRYLSFMASYDMHKNVNKVARGYGYKMEEYYEFYIYSVTEDESQVLFRPFRATFADGNYVDDMSRLERTLNELSVPKDFPSIINMDTYFFGLIYHILFCHKAIDISKKDEIHTRIEAAVAEMKDTDKHAQAPAQFQYMRFRITKSLEIYNDYLMP